MTEHNGPWDGLQRPLVLRRCLLSLGDSFRGGRLH